MKLETEERGTFWEGVGAAIVLGLLLWVLVLYLLSLAFGGS